MKTSSRSGPLLERAVAGALRSAIHDHGAITADKVGSAVKRVVGNLKNAGDAEPARPPAAPREKRDGRPVLGHDGHGGGDPRSCKSCRLRRARERLGLTQAELAAKLRASHRSVQRWEREPDAVDATALQLAELLGANR